MISSTVLDDFALIVAWKLGATNAPMTSPNPYLVL